MMTPDDKYLLDWEKEEGARVNVTRKAHNDQRRKVACERCGKVFLASPSKHPHFCSRACFHPPIYARCETCGVEIRVNAWRHDNRKHLFCSFTCRCKAAERTVIVRCFMCGSPFSKKASQVSRSLRHFCSPKCSVAYHVAGRHWAFCGGKGYGPEWRRIAKAIRLRDVVCRRCGKTKKQNGRSLDVHHVVSFENFGYDNRAEAHASGNLVSLCRSCHKWTEEHHV